ncbi:hypothetical protein CERSUDRAFT_117279 [Gelatoporia subvermispora B]|uniref:Uncharacterized protein n=1 Tax=Ceriporiopsis subvermispora (strain B) TaxID=914234 RepID=M2R7M1_CERS8|nr:hypothetical protein CERSUDRAFT_117279 [Gelatoporia subvermispora B]
MLRTNISRSYGTHTRTSSQTYASTWIRSRIRTSNIQEWTHGRIFTNVLPGHSERCILPFATGNWHIRTSFASVSEERHKQAGLVPLIFLGTRPGNGRPFTRSDANDAMHEQELRLRARLTLLSSDLGVTMANISLVYVGPDSASLTHVLRTTVHLLGMCSPLRRCLASLSGSQFDSENSPGPTLWSLRPSPRIALRGVLAPPHRARLRSRRLSIVGRLVLSSACARWRVVAGIKVGYAVVGQGGGGPRGCADRQEEEFGALWAARVTVGLTQWFPAGPCGIPPVPSYPPFLFMRLRYLGTALSPRFPVRIALGPHVAIFRSNTRPARHPQMSGVFGYFDPLRL